MSLKDLLKHKKQQTTAPKKDEVCPGEVELFIPPEYDKTIAEWVALFDAYNRSERPIKTADAISRVIAETNPDKDLRALYRLSAVTNRNSRFYAKPIFTKEKESLTALIFYKAEKLNFVPILNKDQNQIIHVVLTYTNQ